jgi:hypothetical protein
VRASHRLSILFNHLTSCGELSRAGVTHPITPKLEATKIMSANTVVRAFELARGGLCRNVGQIRSRLKTEGYASIQEHLEGPSIRKQLADAIKGATVRGKS